MPMCNSSDINQHFVTVPNPWENSKTFGQRLSQWALHNNHPEQADKAGRSSSSSGCGGDNGISATKDDLWLGGDKLLQVSLGYYWNSKRNSSSKRHPNKQHMAMVLEVTNIDGEDAEAGNNDGEERIVVDEEWEVASEKKKQSRLGSVLRQQKPIWTLNCYMGGGGGSDDDTPLVLSQLDSQQQRPWATMSSSNPKHEWLEVYHMKAMTFDTLLRRFIRWGYAVGSMSMTTASTSSRNRQRTSVALLTTWWMQEAGHHLLGGGRYGIPATKTAARLATIREPAFQEIVAPSIAHAIHKKPYYYDKLFGCFIRNKTRTRAEENTKYQLIGFLSSAGVADIMDMNDDKVTDIIEEYDMRRKSNCRSSGSKFCAEDQDSGDLTYDTNTCSGTFYSGTMMMEEEESPAAAYCDDNNNSGCSDVGDHCGSDYGASGSGNSENEKDVSTNTLARCCGDGGGRGMPSTLTNSQTHRWLGDGPTPEEYQRLPSFLLNMSKRAKDDPSQVPQ